MARILGEHENERVQTSPSHPPRWADLCLWLSIVAPHQVATGIWKYRTPGSLRIDVVGSDPTPAGLRKKGRKYLLAPAWIHALEKRGLAIGYGCGIGDVADTRSRLLSIVSPATDHGKYPDQPIIANSTMVADTVFGKGGSIRRGLLPRFWITGGRAPYGWKVDRRGGIPCILHIGPCACLGMGASDTGISRGAAIDPAFPPPAESLGEYGLPFSRGSDRGFVGGQFSNIIYLYTTTVGQVPGIEQ